MTSLFPLNVPKRIYVFRIPYDDYDYDYDDDESFATRTSNTLSNLKYCCALDVYKFVS